MTSATNASETRCVCLTPGLGIALAGGGGRGIAQIGVLTILDREGIRVEYVAGTSIGAIIGGLYALTGSGAEVERRVLEYLRRAERTGRPSFLWRFRAITGDGSAGNGYSVVDRLRHYGVVGRGLLRPTLASEVELRTVLDELFDGKSFQDTKLPFAATAVDLVTGRRLIFAAGPLADAVYASAALPGIVPPLELDGYRLIDGGFGEPVPVEACRYLGAGRVIAVDVLGRPPASAPAATSLAAAMRADQIARAALEREHLAKADLVVSPEVEAIDWADFSQPESRIAEGERAALGKLKQIREMLSDFEGRFVRGSFAVRACRPEVGAVPAGSAP